ncbi:MAG: O-antigen ligase family protein [Verrucomicrobiota bacterium]
MPERPPPSAASLTWRLSEAAPLAPAADVLLRQRLAALSSIGFLLGYYCMHNQWVQLTWVGIMTLAWFWEGGFQDFIDSLRLDRWMVTMAAVSLLMLARSSVIDSLGITVNAFWLGWLGTGTLMLVLMTLWSVARQPRAPLWLGVPLVGVATLTATGSMLVFYVLDPKALFGQRLQNWFIYGGWNTVCTGLTFGFAAVWSSWNWCHSSERRERWLWLIGAVVLMFATLLTMSRGALLALVAAHGVWLLALGWRRSRKAMFLMVGCVLLFQASAPIIAHIGAKELSDMMGVPTSAITPEILGDGIVAANPAARLLDRADNGRIIIYTAGLQSLTTWQDWVLGKGLWADNDCWSCSLPWYPEHLHSIFMTALVRGGLPGLAGLLLLIGWGFRRAWSLAREGEALWLVLASFGVFGLLFDGDSAFSMLTIPRFEALILWVPLVIASARHVAANDFAKTSFER